MKNIVSLLAVAVFAITFGAACGKNTECKQATSKAKCVKEEFEEGKFNCKWVPNTDAKDKDKDGKCEVEKKDADAEKKAKRDAAQAECAKGVAADCASKTAEAQKKDDTAECKMSTDATPVCKAVDKQ